MGVGMPSSVANNNNHQHTYDDVEEDEESNVEELQSNQSAHGHQSEEQDEVAVAVEEEEEEVESEEASNQQEFTNPPKQSDKKDQSTASHFTHLPPLYPNPYQYQALINPNMPYSMQIAGAPVAPDFIPFNYYRPQPSPTNHMVTHKPTKKKPSSNSKKPATDSNKQSEPTEKPNKSENDSFESAKPSKPNRKDKPTASMNPNQMYTSSQTYPSGANAFLGQNQNAPILNPFNSFNAHPFNNQFTNALPFYTNGFSPFFNYMNHPNGFNSANDFPSQFGQTNPLNQYGNNPFVSNSVGISTAPYQNNPNFNIPRNFNSPFAYHQSMNQKFNGNSYPQYFANPSSTSH